MTSYTDSNTDWKGKLFNTMLKAYPYDNEDKTMDAVSNRITFLYGQLYELDQLNQGTFDALHEMFGVANIKALSHLSTMVREQKLINAEGEDIYMPNLQKAFNIPITFISGQENVCFLPESTENSYELLKQLNPEMEYNRHVIKNYGHIDCIFGKNASRDVYPKILEHFEKQV